MELIHYNETYTSFSTTEKEGIFISENLGDNKTFDAILEKFNNYRFTEHLSFLRNDHDCQSYSSILFSIIFIINKKEKKFFLFTAVMEIPNRNEIQYSTSTIYEDVCDREKIVNDLLKNNLYDKVFVRAEMDIKFYTSTSLDIYQDEEEEYSEDDDLSPAIIESCFMTDNCTICLLERPKILFFPCLHLSICEECEKVGNLINCSVCRKRIKRKIKI